MAEQENQGDIATADPSAEPAEQPAPAPDTRPWARWLAKMTDLALTSFVFFVLVSGASFVFFFVLSSLNPARAEQYLLQLASIPFMIASVILFFILFMLGEATLISATGSTPGKALLGIRVMDRSGGRLSFPKSLLRSARAWAQGLGLGIPLVSIITMIFGYMALSDRGDTAWDRDVNADYRTHEVGPVRWTIGILVWLTSVAIDIANRVLTQNGF